MNNYIRNLQKTNVVWDTAKMIEAEHKAAGREYTYQQVLQEALAKLELTDKPRN